MRHTAICVLLLIGCSESGQPTAETRRHQIDPYVGREVPLAYRKVFRKPKLSELRADGADDATVRARWAEAMSQLSNVARLTADGTTLVVSYSPAVKDRVCVAENWAKGLYDLPALGFTSVRCASGGVAAVPDDGGRARRQRLVERAHELVTTDDVGLVWHESEGMTITAIVAERKCNRSRLAKIAATIKKAGIDLRGAGFEKIVCSVDPGELRL